ncbi:siroheme synthase [Halobacteriales archaeon SW_8_68_21]|nr:MAG: siroheme synthase [Halobacteriales archaeon SW_8_68_21]
MTPLYHDFAGGTVVVFGGGPVGARKARGFDDAACVVVVSPAFDERLRSLADGRDGESDGDDEGGRDGENDENDEDGRDGESDGDDEDGRDGESDGDGEDGAAIELIRAAPDADAVGDWLDRGLLVNRTDVSGERDPGSVVVPATVEDDPVTVALSTGGTSPALAKALRERIETEIDGAGEMARLSGEIREELKSKGIAPEKRREAVRRVVRSRGVWKGLQKGRSYGRQEADTVIEEVLDR